jgi:hypothetical protein
MTGVTIHIHEDDWGLRNLRPMQAWREAAADLAEAEAASLVHRVPGDFGFSDVHVIADASVVGYGALGVSLDALRSALAAHLPRVAQFNATASCGFVEGAHDVMGFYQSDPDCYGLSNDCFVKIDSLDGVVTGLWFERPSDEAGLARLRAALIAVDRVWPSFVADYVEGAQGAVSDAAFLDDYLRAEGAF